MYINIVLIEKAHLKAEEKTNYKILEDYKTIRDYLVEIDLITHNSRVTFPNQIQNKQNGVE